MRGKRVLSMAVLALFIVASAGALHAGGWHKSGASEEGKMSSMEPPPSGSEIESHTWQYQEALDTGSLPATDAGEVRGAGGFGGEVIHTIEAGGLTYRLGVDTP